jgi:hypothetical protein
MNMRLQWMVLGALVVLTGCNETPDTNPIKSAPLTQAERQAQADDRKERRDLADQVANEDISFEEAGCQYRGGDWDDKKEVCDRYFLVPHNQKGAAQSDLLAAKIHGLAAMTMDQATAGTEATETATTHLSFHPEDYRGALFAAIHALRKDKLLPPKTSEQDVAITRLAQ